MGTRSHTHVIEKWEGDKETILCTIYRQMDGYPTGQGKEIAEFLRGLKVVNGIMFTKDAPKVRRANGGGCLAAQLIAHLKDGIGSIYLARPGEDSDGIDYEYHVMVTQTTNGGSVTMRCSRGWNSGRVLFDGRAEDFDADAVEKKEYVCRGDETEEELDKIVDRGISPVRVKRIGESGELPMDDEIPGESDEDRGVTR